MKNKTLSASFQLLSITILSLSTVIPSHADTITWVNTLGGDWNDAGNWNPNQVPGPTDTATLAIGLTGSLTVPDGNVLNWNSGSMTSGGALSIASNAVLNWNNGTVGSGAVLTVASNAVVNWLSGEIDGAVTVAAGGVLNLTNSVFYYFSGGTLTNNGTVNWVAGTIYGYNGAVIYNAGLWDAQADSSTQTGGTTAFINAGTFRKSGGAGTTAVNWPFSTPGLIDQQTGLLNLNWSGDNTLFQNFSGPITLNGGATLTLSSNITLNWTSGSINSGSSLSVVGGSTLNWINGTVASGAQLPVAPNAVVNWLNGEIDGAVTVAAGGVLNLTNNVFYYFAGGTLTNNGTVNWVAGSLYGYNGAVIYNAGLWDAQADSSTQTGGTTAFINAGTFRKSGGAGTTAVNWPFNTSGVIDQQTGLLNLNWSGDNTLRQNFSGPVTLSSGATLTLSNMTLNWTSGSINSGSSLSVIGGSTLNWINGTIASGAALSLASGTVVNWANGEIDGAVTVAAGGVLNLTNNVFYYFAGGTLTNNGTVNWVTGSLYGYNGAVIYNAGLWDVQSDVNAQTGGTTTFINAGTFRKSGGAGTTTIGWPFNTPGLIDQQTGLLSINWSGDNTLFQNFAGPVTLNGGATLTLSSNMAFNWTSGSINSGGSLSVVGGSTLNWINGTVAAGAALSVAANAVANWSNGEIDGTVTVAAGGVLNVTNNTYYYFGGGSLTNNGTANWMTGTLYGYGGAVIYNAGLWDAQSDSSALAGGTTTFINTGTFRKSGGAGTMTVGWAMPNSGILTAQTGTIYLAGSYDLTGGTMCFGLNSSSDYGKITLNGSASLTGTLSANLNNGFYPVAGDSFNVLSYGSQTGTFTNFELPPSQAWTETYGATIFTLAVSNSAPMLPAQTNPALDELTLLTVTNTAVDLDVPANNIAYALLTAPTNASISAEGVITWTPDETQGPSTNTFTTTATDDGSPSLSATNIFTVVVNEVNVAPALPAQMDLAINESATLTLTNTATDSDIPVNGLAYTLTGPVGASISASGIITWTTTESSGPSTNTFTTVVTDTNLFAINAQNLSATNTFTVVVNEVNVAPMLTLPPDMNINELVAYFATATATDSDLPTNALAFALVSGPTGLTVSPTGVINWIPAEEQGPSTNTVTIRVTDSNPPAVNATSLSMTNSYTLIVNEVNVAPVLTLPPDTNINEQVAFTVTATATDTDVPTNTLTFALVSGPSGLTVSPVGVINWNPAEDQGPSTNLVKISVTDTNSIAFNATSFSVTNSYTLVVNEVNIAPTLPGQTNLVIDEGLTLTVTNTASDADVPTNLLTYTLLVAPGAATISTNGIINWVTTEADGPGTNTFTTKVSDNGSPNLSATNTFNVVVNEVNVTPVLTLPPDTNINELVAYTATATATDADIPTNTLTFALVSGPSGLTVSPSGVINWTPLENQGPGTNTVKISVTDTNPAAVNAKSLSVTNSCTLIVNEVNVAPVLPPQSDVTIHEGNTLTVTNTASDSDLPTNALTYMLLVAPGTATISTNGIITWLTTEADGPGTNLIKTKVVDDGSPALSATNTFSVVVQEVNVSPVLTLPPDTNINEQVAFTVTATATDADIPTNLLTFALVSGPSGLTVSAAGIINWNPAENQSPSTNIVKISVTDTNPFAVNATSFIVTNQFQIIVNEVNVAPTLPGQTNLLIDEGLTLTVTNTASDTDVPTNLLTYTLLVAPGAATISTNGIINWVTTEADGPGTNTFTTKVTDNGSPNLSVTNSFMVVVNEVNVAPVVGVLGNYTVNPGQTISFTATATDADLPANILTFALISPPSGATISGSGLFNWRPTIAQADTTNTVKVKVTDNGSPNLSGTNSFTVIVNPLAPVVLTALGYTNAQFTLQVSGTTGPDYILSTSTNLTQWTDLFTNLSPAMPFSFTDTNAASFPDRFYRARPSP